MFFILFLMIGNGYTKQRTSSSTIACKATVAKSTFPGKFLLFVLVFMLYRFQSVNLFYNITLLSFKLGFLCNFIRESFA